MNKVLIGSLVLYVIACCLPALEFKNSGSAVATDVMLGLRALAVGWSGIFAGVFAWYANPAGLVSLILMVLRKPAPSLVFAVIAIALASTTFLLIGRELPGDEGGVTKTTVVKLLPGFYVWMASIVAVPVAAWFPRGG